MTQKVTRFFGQITPFIIFGILIMVGIMALVLLSWLLFWGTLLGIILYIVLLIKSKLFPRKHPVQLSARIFEYKDIDKKNNRKHS